MIRQKTIASPVGPLTLRADDHALVALQFEGEARHDAPEGDTPILAQAERELAEYFAGARQRFEVPLRSSGSPFQERVWSALLGIGFGETRSYAALARAIGRPRACRAVGSANGRNPIALIVPCHRVIGADGTLTGYGGGLERKRWLLEHERAALRLARAAC